MSRLAVVAAAVLVLAVSAGAVEYHVTAKFLGVNPGAVVTIKDYSTSPRLRESIWAGVYNFQIKSGTDYTELGAIGDEFSTFCIDIANSVSTNHTYTWTVVPLSGAPNPSVYSDGQISATEELALQKLYGWATATYPDLFTSNTKAAAFQAAVWEIINESGATLDITSGNFKADGVDTSLVSTMLTTSGSYQGQLPTLMALTSSCAQDQMFLLPGYGPPPPVIPEPISVVAVLLGLGGLGKYVRGRLGNRI